MADEGEEEVKEEKPFYVDRAKTGRAACKKCKQKIQQGELRMGKLGYNPFSSGTMKHWHHVPCMFEVFSKQRKTTKRIDSYSEIDGWDTLPPADKKTIESHFSKEELEKLQASAAEEANAPAPKANASSSDEKDNSFRAFRKLCSELTNASSYLTKTSLVKEFFEKGSDGKSFKGDLQIWVRSLLPMANKRVYNLQSKQLVKIFSDILRSDQDEMLEDLEKGDVAETVGNFFEKSSNVTVAKKAVLTLPEVDSFLEYLSKLTREADQIEHFKSILPKCTVNDLKIVIRLIKHDLRINAGPKHILEALDTNAYPAYQASRDLAAVVSNTMKAKKGGGSKSGEGIKVGIKIMTPVLPMLAEACSSVEMAFRKCPDGMFSEIKYDGERVQLHKEGDVFKYFSRSLKPVLDHKVRHFEKYIPEAFPHGKDLILDCEILMMDTKTGKPLPFGTLGAHKKAEFKDACVCLFVFDCIYYNGESLIDRPIKERREILLNNMTEITHRVVFSEMEEIYEREDLEAMMERVFREGLEGLVIKSLKSKYEPGKRHWLKVKKDYLAGGTMADSADLVVLGAWFGTGKKGGIMSVFLMGCHDEKRNRWVTVTKVHGGHDDKTLESLQKELKMDKISRDASRVPSWLNCAKTMVPDFVAKDPKDSQVWEISGAEFTCNQVHTANGISIRFPRVTRIRKDKTWETATSLTELKQLYENSKDTSNFTLNKEGNRSEGKKKDEPAKKEDKKRQREVTPDDQDRKRHKDESDSTPKKQDSSGKETNKTPGSRKRKDSEDEKSDKSPGKDNSKRRRSKERSRSPSRSKRTHSKNKERKGSRADSEKRNSERKRSKERSPKRKHEREQSQDRANSEKNSREREKDRSGSRSRSKDKSNESSSKRKPESEQSRDRPNPGKNSREKEKDRSGSRSRSEDKSYESRSKRSRSTSRDVPKKKRKLFSDTSGSETEVDEDPTPTQNVAIAMKNRLPDVFTNQVFLFHENVDDLALLKRFVIAYGGKLYNESKKTCLENGIDPITHVIYPGRKIDRKLDTKSDNTKHVSRDWLWESIKEKKLATEHDYKVKVQSS